MTATAPSAADQAHTQVDLPLLTDQQVMDFVIDGYHIVQPDFRPGLNQAVCDKLDALDHNPGDGVYDAVSELAEVWQHPTVRGALASLLGGDYQMSSHRHWHFKPAGSGHMNWHQDSRNQRHHQLRVCLALYYPHDVTADMGPTIVVPGTHLRNAPTDRMVNYRTIRGQVPLTVKAGTIAITHYDIWHGTAANRSDRGRHMLKFLFARTSEPTAPSWRHEPEGLAFAYNSAFGRHAIACGQSDHYKELALRREMWDHMCGKSSGA